MPSFPLTSLSTLLSVLVYFSFIVTVGRARMAFGVAAPLTSGNIEFDKRFRVQMNTLEQMVIFLPVLWLCAAWVGDPYAAAGGVLWSVGRIVYAVAYYGAAEKRGPGFLITMLATFGMLVATLVAIVRSFFG